MGGEMHWWDIGSGLKAQMGEYLQKQGYDITEEAKLLGQSGMVHTFDLLAQKDDGFATHNIAVCFVSGGEPDVEVDTVFSFANKAYDTGISTRIVIGVLWLSPKTKRLAQKQRLNVLEADQVTKLLASKPMLPVKPNEPIRFETREQLVQSLISLGYRVVENAKIRGGSGISYTFDILAYSNNGINDQLSQCLVVDFLTGENEVSLKQVSLFDSRAREVAIDNKVVVVSPRLNVEAKQFAKHRQIKVFELGLRPVADIVAEKKSSPPKEEPVKAEVKSEAPGVSPPTKLDEKVDVVSTRPSDGARQSAQQPRIEIIELGEREAAKPIVNEEKPSPPNEEPAKAEEKSEALVGAEPPTKHLRDAVKPAAWRLIPEVIAGKYNAVHTDDVPVDTSPVDKAEEVSSGQGSLFNTEAYEVPIDDKVGVAASRSSAEASQSAQHRQIKLFDLVKKPVAKIVTEEKPSSPKGGPTKLDDRFEAPDSDLGVKPVVKPIMAEEKPSLPKEEPAKAGQKSEASGAEPHTKQPRHAVQPEALRLISEVMARRYNAVPLAISGNTLEVAMADPNNTVAIQVLSALSRMKIEPVAADAEAVLEAIDLNYKKAGVGN